jgi:hypothetical protein
MLQVHPFRLKLFPPFRSAAFSADFPAAIGPKTNRIVMNKLI